MALDWPRMSGEHPPDASRRQRRPSLRDVGLRAGVAVSSASRALAGHPDVHPETRDRVLAAAAELGYERNMLAEGLRSGATHTVGFVVRDIGGYGLGEIGSGAEHMLSRRGYTILFTSSRDDPSLDVDRISLLEQRRVDGLLLLLTSDDNEATVSRIRRLAVPFVLVDRDPPPGLSCASVLCDHRSGARAAVAHLAGLGHRHIGIAAGPLHVRPGRELIAGITEAADELGVRVSSEIGAFTPRHGEAAASKLLDLDDRPTAIVAGSHDIALGVLRVVQARGLRVPDDLSLVTNDAFASLGFADAPLAAITYRPRHVGERAASLLLGMLEGAPATSELVSTFFDPRGSCGPPGSLRRATA
jgi:LacI family transcriptional regulator